MPEKSQSDWNKIRGADQIWANLKRCVKREKAVYPSGVEPKALGIPGGKEAPHARGNVAGPAGAIRTYAI